MPQVTVGIVVTPSKYYVDEGVPAIRSLNVKDGRLTDEELVFFSEEDNRKLAKTRIYKDDVVIVRTGQTGACAVVDERFDGANCIDLIIVRQSRHLRSKFLQYFLASGEAAAEITMSSNGAIQQHFNIGLVREIGLLQPSVGEQDAILAFLDRETAKIDRLMEVRRKQMERLQEQRTAVIHHAVTKGLNPNSKMKPSRVEWLGEIPSHWEEQPLWTVARMQVSNVDKHSLPGEQSVRLCNYVDVYKNEKIEGNLEFMEATATPAEIRKFGLQLGDVIITKDSEDPHDIAVPAIIAEEIPSLVCGYHLAILRASHGLTPGYLFRLLQTVDLRSYFATKAQGVTRFGLSQNAITRCYLTVPPIPEQVTIVAYIDHETNKIGTLISKYRRELELLAEYRASLISLTVTGKIDVRGLVTPTQPDAP
jgi:type I restriction enzyme S subunit